MKVHVKHAELSYQAKLVSPLFHVLGKVEGLYQGILSHLAPFGVQLTNLKIESSSSSPGDAVLACYLIPLSGVLRYRLDRYEAFFSDPRRIGQDTINNVVLNGLEALRSVAHDLAVRAHTLVLGIHGEIDGDSLFDQMREYVNIPSSRLRGIVSAGVVFYLGSDGPRSEAIVLLDKSDLVRNGLFLRVTTEIDGRKVAPSEVHRYAIEDFTMIIKGFGVELTSGGK